MEDGPETKRARQACQNCRRKKVRCSGERPSCAFCTRLKQSCLWGDREDAARPGELSAYSSTNPLNTSNATLTARVALLESKLNLLSHGAVQSANNYRFTGSDTVTPHSDQLEKVGHASGNDTSSGALRATFSQLPQGSVLDSLVDTYFTHCHNQPYALFHEATFRRRLNDASLPQHLLYAFAATACRFSALPLYEGRQADATAAYANASWKQIIEHSFSSKISPEFSMVQTINMLAVIDYTCKFTSPLMFWVHNEWKEPSRPSEAWMGQVRSRGPLRPESSPQ